MIVPRRASSSRQFDDTDPRCRDRRPDVGDAARRRRRRLIASGILVAVVGLLWGNAVAVSRGDAEATGTSTLPLEGGNIYVTQDGPRDAPALVLIHGLAASTRSWDLLVPMLARSHRVIRIDLLGHGRSAKPAGGGYEIPQEVVDDVRGMTYHAFTATSRAANDYLEHRVLPDRLTPLGKPLLVIFGTEDRRWRSSSAAEYRAVPGATVELLPGIGHSPVLEDPQRTTELLLAFTANHAAQTN